jgi:hypothetical protein
MFAQFIYSAPEGRIVELENGCFVAFMFKRLVATVKSLLSPVTAILSLYRG